MFSLQRAFLRPQPLRAARASLLPKIGAEHQRFIYKKTGIEIQIIDMLYDYANVPQNKISLDANLENSLLLDRLDRYGFQWDLQEIFEFQLGYTRDFARDLQSGREAADWVAAKLEELNRLEI
ncbi:hypothetical protein BC829DRAFT_380602 [Chytridium lagenaria]|nr:hypothetical protein BC829DRAFT_380602 [Chytridium lagenaria]